MGGGADTRRATATSLKRLVEYRSELTDLLLLAFPVVALVGVFQLPMPTRRALAFQTTGPTFVTAYTSHFVHYSLSHLLTNLVGYLAIAPLAYVLSVGAGRRRQFLVAHGTFLLGLPFALSLLNYLFLRPGTAIGFSGIVLGFFGYLPIALYQFVGRHAEGRAPTRYLPMAFFLGIGSIALVLFWSVFITIGIFVAAVVVIAAYSERFVDRELITGVGRLKQSGFAETVLAGTILLLAYPVVAFPTTAVFGTRVVNLLAHFFGYALSFISTFITIVSAKWSDTVRGFGNRLQ